MITYIVGIPGSGKSYKAVYALYSNFAKDKTVIKDKSYQVSGMKRALTNINELDLEKFDNVFPIDWEEFYENLTTLHTQYKQKVDDTQLKNLAEQLGMKDTFIILDECHNYLDIQDKVLIWWLSYHRHLHQEIYLLTQNLSLVHSKYKPFSEFFYKAHPSSLKLFNNVMKYSQFPSSRMSLNTKSGVKKIPIVQEVFESYGSGKNQNSKSLILKFLIMATSLFIILIAVVYIIKTSMSNDNVKKETLKKDNTNEVHIVDTYIKDKPKQKNKSSFIDLEDLKFMRLICNLEKKYCLYNGKSINLNFYLKMKSIQGFQEISINRLNNGFYELNVFVTKTFYNIFQKGVENEKSNLMGDVPSITDSFTK